MPFRKEAVRLVNLPGRTAVDVVHAPGTHKQVPFSRLFNSQSLTAFNLRMVNFNEISETSGEMKDPSGLWITLVMEVLSSRNLLSNGNWASIRK